MHVPPSLFPDNELRFLDLPCMLMIGDDDVINRQEAIEKQES